MTEEKRKVILLYSNTFESVIRAASNSLGAILFSSMRYGDRPIDQSYVHFHRSTSCNIFTARDQERSEVCKASDMLWILIPAKVVHPSLLDMPMTRIIRMYIRVYMSVCVCEMHTTRLSLFQAEILTITWQMNVSRWRLHLFSAKEREKRNNSFNYIAFSSSCHENNLSFVRTIPRMILPSFLPIPSPYSSTTDRRFIIFLFVTI